MLDTPGRRGRSGGQRQRPRASTGLWWGHQNRDHGERTRFVGGIACVVKEEVLLCARYSFNLRGQSDTVGYGKHTCIASRLSRPSWSPRENSMATEDAAMHQ